LTALDRGVRRESTRNGFYPFAFNQGVKAIATFGGVFILQQAFGYREGRVPVRTQRAEELRAERFGFEPDQNV
jgi:hypothetical protein